MDAVGVRVGLGLGCGVAVCGALLLLGCGSEPAADDALALPCTPNSNPLGLTRGKNAAGEYRIWPAGRVPYEIDSTVGAATKAAVLAAMNDWQSKTEQRVRFEPATQNDAAFVSFLGAPDPVTSHVGYQPATISKVKLRNPESVRVARHEIGHVLGLQHEQRRDNREAHIKVVDVNIVKTNFCKDQFSVCASCVPLVDYNVSSVMHYRTSDLKSCRTGPVLLHKDGSNINHTWVLTDGDLASIAALYGPAPGSGGTSGTGGTGGASGAAGAAGSGGISAAGGAAPNDAGIAAGAAGTAGINGIDNPDDVPEGSGGASATAADNGGCALARGRDDASGLFAAFMALFGLALLRSLLAPSARRPRRACSS